MSQIGPAGEGEGRAPTVFFSYSRVDFARVEPVIRLLEQAGFAVWWDGKLAAGVKYVESTEQALETAQAVVVAWSASSSASHWVRDEAMSGRDRGCLVPLSLDGSLPPLGFRQFQVLDFAGWQGAPDAAVAQELVRATAALHGRAPLALALPPLAPPLLTPPPGTASGPPAAGTRGVTRRQGMVYLGLGAAAVAAGAAGWSLYRAGGGAAGTANSIAVLPFANDSRDPAQDYLSAGLAAELRTMLTRNQALQVIARSSSEAMIQRGLDAVAAARELGVAYIVEGAVQVAGNTVRVSSDLIDGATGVSRWSRTFDEPLDGLLALQASLAQSITAELLAQLGPQPAQQRLGQASVPAAFDAYLKGWDLAVRSSDTATDLQVLRLFQQAAQRDSGFAGARAGEAAAYLALGHTAETSAAAQAYYASAAQAAQQAVALGPELAEAHSVYAQTLFEGQLKVAEARAAYQESLAKGGGSAPILARAAEYLALTGNAQAARQPIERAVLLDPLNPAMFKSAGLVRYAAGDHAGAVAQHRRALQLDGTISGAHAWIASALLQSNDVAGALHECALEPYASMRLACLAIAQHRNGNAPAAQAALAGLVAEYGDAAAYQQAQVLAQWGQGDAALEKLALARNLGDAGLTYLLIDPLLDPLRGRPELNAMLQGLGFS